MDPSQRRRTPHADAVAAAWRDDRDHVAGVVARIVRDEAEAADVVAEAFARLAAQPPGTVRDPRGWLVVVGRRLALDRLRSARERLTDPVDPAAPRTALDRGGGADLDGGTAGPADPADRVTLDDEIRRALWLVIDRLSPGERAAFVLHDVFGVPFADVGVLLGRTSAACRQLASRARATIRAAEPVAGARTPPRERDLDRVAAGFAAACAEGDLDGLAALLADDVSGWAVRDEVLLDEVRGRDAVAAGATAFFGPRSPWGLVPLALDATPTVLVTRHGEPEGVIRLDLDDHGLIARLRAVLLAGDRAADARP